MYKSMLRSFVSDVVYTLVISALRERYIPSEIQEALDAGIKEAELDFISEVRKQEAGH